MTITRRHVLIGLGAVVGGAGMFAATGAFDQVEAQRNFELEVSGDAGALLGLEALNDQVVHEEGGGAGDNDIIAFELAADEGLNENARTGFFDAFSITNNGSNTVNISIDTGDADGVEFIVEEDQLDGIDSDVDLADGDANWAPGESADVDIFIDTTTDGGYTEPGTPYQMTITATTEDV